MTNRAVARQRKPEEIRESAGRPSLYKPEYCAAVITFMGDNHGLTAFASSIGIPWRTVYDWKKLYPEFGEACEIGTGMRLFEVENVLAKPKSGPQIAGAIFTAKNIAPHEYREKVELVSDGAGEAGLAAMKTAITAGVSEALKQLGSQTVGVMAGMRIISHDVERGGAMPDVIEGVFEDVTERDEAPERDDSSSTPVIVTRDPIA